MYLTSTRKERRAKSRALRARLRDLRKENRAAAKARKNVATGTPQTARTHLVAAGVTDHTAKRFAGAFSRGVTPTTTREARIKLKGRTRKTVAAKLYDAKAFAARLASYRPRNPLAAVEFGRAAQAVTA